jgi:hypothetical protein
MGNINKSAPFGHQQLISLGKFFSQQTIKVVFQSDGPLLTIRRMVSHLLSLAS